MGDPALPAGQTPLQQRRARLRTFAYSTLRVIELQCAWVALVAPSPLKIAIGKKLGYDARRMEALTARLAQAGTDDAGPAAPAAHVAALDAATGLEDPAAIAGWLTDHAEALVREMEAYRRELRGSGDQPSDLLLATAIAELAPSLADLRAFASSARQPVDLALSITVPEAELVAYTGQERLPRRVDFPARDAKLTRGEAIRQQRSEEMSKEGLQLFLHMMYVDVEIAATEVCGRMIIEHRDTPLAFKLDMCRQAWDESRHAEMVLAELESLGGHEGQFPYTGAVWERYRLADDLPERLAIQQCVQEGNSCDRAVPMERVMRHQGFVSTADMMEQVTADEILHVQFGNRWLLHLCGADPARYEATMRRAQDKIAFSMSAVNARMRRLAGFPEWYIPKLRERFKELNRRAP